MRKRIYLAGPLTCGDLAVNINRATEAFNRLMELGFAPMCPHWSCFAGGVKVRELNPEGPTVIAEAQVQPTKATYAEWLDLDFAWVRVCHALLRLPGESTGADAEVAHARERGIPVFESIEAVADAYYRGELDQVEYIRDRLIDRDA